MWRVVLRGFFSRKLRATLTGIAIALGVALMAGTYILTDTINQSFATIFQNGERGRDVVVVPHQALGASANVQSGVIGASTLTRARACSIAFQRRRRASRTRRPRRRRPRRPAPRAPA